MASMAGLAGFSHAVGLRGEAEATADAGVVDVPTTSVSLGLSCAEVLK